LTCIDED